MSVAEESENIVYSQKTMTENFSENPIFDNLKLNYEVVIAIIVLILSLIPVYIFYKRVKSRNAVLFLGLSDSGKTLLFSRLLHKKFVQTHTSVKENRGDYERDHGQINVIDIPGHERLRQKFFDQYKSLARGLVFVIDAATFQKDIRDVAEYLYTILTDNVIASTTPQILVLCNKQDEATAKTSSAVCQLLQKEMNTLRVTKASQLESVDSSVKSNSVLGKDGKEFEFAYLPYKVVFAECAAVNKDEEKSAKIDPLLKWLQKL